MTTIRTLRERARTDFALAKRARPPTPARRHACTRPTATTRTARMSDARPGDRGPGALCFPERFVEFLEGQLVRLRIAFECREGYLPGSSGNARETGRWLRFYAGIQADTREQTSERRAGINTANRGGQ